MSSCVLIINNMSILAVQLTVVVSTVASQQNGPGFNPLLGPGVFLRRVCVFFLCVGFLQGLRFPPTIQKPVCLGCLQAQAFLAKDICK